MRKNWQLCKIFLYLLQEDYDSDEIEKDMFMNSAMILYANNKDYLNKLLKNNSDFSSMVKNSKDI